MDPSQYLAEFEVSWSAALVGAYYANSLDLAEREGRIGRVPWEPNLEVHTSFDLGIADSTAIWFYQLLKGDPAIRIIDYYEETGKGLRHYVSELKNRDYVYGRHFFPHDVMVRELGTGMSRYEMLRGWGIHPNVIAKLPVADGIEAVRSIIPKCYFDSVKCADGLKKLRSYHRQFNDRTGDWHNRPHHDHNSHAADSFRYLAVSIRDGGRDTDNLSMMARTGKLAGGRPVIQDDYNELS
jgi:hypothetical protein